jgi:uncharacterized protein (DUF58 family)
VTRTPTVKLRLYLAVTAVGAIAALATGHVALIALVAPFGAFVAVGVALAHQPHVAVTARLSRERLLEGDEFTVTVDLDQIADVGLLELELHPPADLAVSGDAPSTLLLHPGDTRELSFKLRADRWGGYRTGTLTCRGWDRLGLIEYQLPALTLPAVRVFPAAEKLRAMVDPLELHATAGSRVARELAEGIEFAEVRPFRPGDRVRRINWRVSARRGSPYVSDRHPERNADVILFLDTFTDVGEARTGTLAFAVRAAAALAASYLARKDRVGVIGFGGVLHGLGPRLGTTQLYRILDALITSEVVLSYAQKRVAFVPRRLLPAKALVIAITPLIDERSIGALFDLRARGFDLVVLDVSPVPTAAAGETPAAALAYRLWLLRRRALQARFEQLGATVSEWRTEQPLELAVTRTVSFRRRTRHPTAA